MLLAGWLNTAVSRLRGTRQRSIARTRHGVMRGTSLSVSLATRRMLWSVEPLEDRALLSSATVNFDSLDASLARVSGAPLATYLASYGITLSSVTAGTTVAVMADQNIYGGDPINPPSIPNILSQFDSNNPVSFTLNFSTPLTSFGFTRPELQSTGGGVSHPAWQAYAFSGLDGTGSQLATASESVMSSVGVIAAANFNLFGPGIRSVRFDSQNSGTGFNAVLLDNFVLAAPLIVDTASDVLDIDANTSSLSALALAPGADGHVSLREALTASNNDTVDSQNDISFAASLNGQTITLGGTELPAITYSVALNQQHVIPPPGGIPSQPLVTIGANHLSRIFDVDASGHPVNFNFNRLVLKDGMAARGGALFNLQGHVAITNSTLTSNVATIDGGAIYNDHGHVGLSDSTLSANTASNNGGGVFAVNTNGGFQATIIAERSTITGNIANGAGGGIYSQGDSVNLTKTNVTNNSATNGGGVAVTETNLFANDGIFNQNTATSASASLVQGGAIAATNSGVSLSGTLLTRNSATGANAAAGSGLAGGKAEGGAVSITTFLFGTSSLFLSGTTLENNTVAGGSGDGAGSGGDAYGGTIYIGGGGVVDLSKSTIAANQANGGAAGATGTKGDGEGGGLWTDADLAITNSTFSGNTATSSGGGAYLKIAAGFPILTHVTATGNRADSDGDGNGSGGGLWTNSAGKVKLLATLAAKNFKGAIGSTTADDVTGTVDAASSDNLIGVNVGLVGITHGSNGNQIGTAGIPIDPLLGPLANNGVAPSLALTKTHALLSGSPAIDAASSSTTSSDQRGFTRNGIRDIGAYESVLDFGDAPTAAQSSFASSYPTTLADNGARHLIGGLSFGSIDSEADGQPTPGANGDDLNTTDDEGGIKGASFVVSFPSGTKPTGSVTVSSTGVGYVSGWIDFNLDGDWNDPGERILNDVPVVAGSNLLFFPVPNGLNDGLTFARFRIAPVANAANVPTGLVQNGEVEDYPVQIGATKLPDGTSSGIASFNVIDPVRRFYDPAIAIGYDYAISSLDGATFESLTLTALPNGDTSFELWRDTGSGFQLVATITAGLQYFFTTGLDENGASFMTAVPGGLSSFRILGINTNELLNPANPLSFATGLSFANMSSSTTFTMTGIAETIYVDNPGDFAITTDQGAIGVLDNGDTVTWIGNPNDGGIDDVTGLIFGATAFGTVTSALNHNETAATSDLTTIRVGYGTFAENLTILTGATLVGSGSANTILDGNASGRVVTVNSGATALLSKLKLTNGSAGSGGGILNSGTLTVVDSTISSNAATFGAGGGGGGVRNSGTLTLTNSTISNNVATVDGTGGGIYNSGTLTVTNSTISSNSTPLGNGGGIYNSGMMTLTNSTLSNNLGGGSGGGGIDNAGTGILNNTIVANSLGNADVNNQPIGTLTGSNNLIETENGSNGLTGTLTSDPQLGPLQDNGGPTFTHAISGSSPALDAGSNAAAAGLSTDQRGSGFARIVDGDANGTTTVDIGAFEFVNANVLPTLSINDVNVTEGNNGTTAMMFTVTLAKAVSSGFTVDYSVVDGIATLADNDYVASQSASLRIGAFDGSRGGVFSLSDGANAAAMRSLIQTKFPAATITGTETLTPQFLASVDVVWLNSVSNNTTSTVPLTASEQAALLAFVQNGGHALIFGENAEFEDESLLDPFGATTNADLGNLQPGTITNTNHVMTNGPFGKVATIQGNFSGAFTALGSAIPLGTWNSNSSVGVAVIDPGVISQTSGRVLLLADVNFYADQLNAADNSKLLLNALASMMAPLPHLTFAGTAGEQHTITVLINGDLKIEPDETLNVLLSNVVGNAEVTILDGNGQGTIVNDDFAGGSPPVITSNGGLATASVSIPENSTAVTTVVATDADIPNPGDTLTYSISGGADASQFSIGQTTGVLTFAIAPDFEIPSDADHNNVYQVVVTVSDSNGNLDAQLLSVTVTDVQATLSINDVTQSEGNNGVSNLDFTVTLDSAVAPFTVRYGIQDGTAMVADNDYVAANPGTLTIGAFDSSRGGVYSLSEGSSAAAMRALIQQTFPGAVIVGASTLTPAFLAGVNGVWLNSVSSNSTATAPLSADEQAALLAYVQNGGSAMIFGENGDFSDESLLDPFGATTTGNLVGVQLGTVTNSIPTLTSGPFGTVTTLQGYFAGNLTEIGSAIPLGTWNASNATNVAVIAPGSLGPSSGGVMLLSDVNFYADQLNNADNSKLLLNALATLVPTSALMFAGTANETHAISISVIGDATIEGDETLRALLSQLSGTNDVTIVKGTGVGTILNDDGNASRPVITSDGSGATASVSISENSTAVTTVTATDNDLPQDTLTFSITGGADAAKFAINPSTGALSFIAPPDFENPTDVGHNNVYEVTVTVADAIGQTDSQAISVTVTDLQATLSIGNAQAPEGSPLSFNVTLSSLVGKGFSVNYASQDGTATAAGQDYVPVHSGNLRVGSFDQTRGGIFSLSDGSSVAAMRTLIESSFPGATFVGSSTLTPAFLASVDVVWLNSVSSNSSAITALSAAEQTALFDFVKNGGHAMIFGEHIQFDDESLLDPFSATTTGTLTDLQAGTITNTNHPLTNGPFGMVTSLQGNYSGTFSELGLATQLGIWNGNGGTSVAVIDPGVIATGSGRVVLFGDVNFYSDQLNAADNSKLLLNALATMIPVEPLSFAGTANEMHTIQVTTNADALTSEGPETLNVLLGQLVGTNDVTISNGTGTGTIDDAPAPPANMADNRVRVMLNDVLLKEGNKGSFKAVLTVQLSAATGQPVTVHYATANAPATPQGLHSFPNQNGMVATPKLDYTPAAGTLTFAPGQTKKTITIPVTGDTLAEATEFFYLNFDASPNAALVRPTAQVTIVDNDPVPSLSINNVSVTEGTGIGGDATFVVKLSKASGAPVTVGYVSLNGTALAGSDFNQVSGTLVFAPGQTSQIVKVHVRGDSLQEANETFLVQLVDPTNSTIRTGTGQGIIKNDDKPPSITINDVAVLEGNVAVFTVVLSASSGLDVSVRYATANGTALANNDYFAATGTLKFEAGETTKTIRVNVGSTITGHATKQFAVNLSAPVNAVFADRRALATILDRN